MTWTRADISVWSSCAVAGFRRCGRVPVGARFRPTGQARCGIKDSQPWITSCANWLSRLTFSDLCCVSETFTGR